LTATPGCDSNTLGNAKTKTTTAMFLLITYDVSTADEKAGARRLRRVAKACASYGVRVQKSVFEMQLGRAEWVELRARLLGAVDLEKDSLRIYFIDQTGKTRTEHHGAGRPPDVVADTLVL
jgi:CRISPR-associated protein Cas2